ncbi:Ribosome-recycling factor [Chlamydiales bacterium STE3]|nr:Ribosome-recycling factor [Chlamydiales bacterium STE3]
MSVLDDTKAKMAAAIEHLKTELKGIRTGKANPSMLDTVQVEIYGTMMRIKDFASVTSPEMRQLLITPFDPQNLHAIAKGIEKANLGLQPIVDGNAVRLRIPQMDESVRKEMVKICHKKGEEAKVSIRNVRREANELIRKQKSNGEIPEDQMKKIEKQIQEQTDKFCKEADTITEQKEKEVMHV